LSQPWSPVGYEVVELSAAGGAAKANPPQVTLAEQVPGRVMPRPMPRSPIGYRVALVADEHLPVVRRVEEPQQRPALALKLRRPPPRGLGALWIPLIALGLLVLVPAVSLTLLVTTRRPLAQPAPMAQAVIPEQMVVVPAALRDREGNAKPAAKPVANAAMLPPVAAPVDECLECAQQAAKDQPAEGRQLRPDREGFETAVDFVRNPQEAARLAKAEEKLLFILHLSGNFEDPGFT
jgi:hypothetical protein